MNKCVSTPLTRSGVSGYAQLCTYSSIVSLAGQAIGNANVKAVGNTPATVFTSDADVASVKKIQKALDLSDTPSNANLAVLAVMADPTTSDSDLPKLAKMLTDDAISKKVWDADKKQKLEGLTTITQSLNDLAKNPDFSKLIADTKAKLRPGDIQPPNGQPAPKRGTTEWQPPTIIVNGNH